MAYISDSTDFSTVNASVNTAIATPLPQGAVNFYDPTMSTGTWYRYYDIDSANVYETANNLVVLSSVGEQNGILQRLSSLIVGSIYNINFEYNTIVFGDNNVLIFSGTTLKSSHVLSAPGPTTQTVQFTASSTEDTIVLDCKDSSLLTLTSITITKAPTLQYLTGFTVKPYEVTVVGQVLFTNGRINNIIPTQLQCEAYGYTYDRTSGTCSAFRFNTLLPVNIQNLNNKLNGPGNTTQLGSNTIQINGTGNTTRGLNNNCFLNGKDNEIANKINNATVNGSMGLALRQGEVVLGGGYAQAGLAQSSKVQLSGVTTDATPINLNVQNIPGDFIEVQENSILGFEIHITRLETGGTSGTAGNFHYLVIKGAARCQGSTGAITLYTYSTTTIASLGTILVTPAVIVDSTTGGIPSITIQVTGAVNIDNLWSATAHLHELRTTTTF